MHVIEKKIREIKKKNFTKLLRLTRTVRENFIQFFKNFAQFAKELDCIFW